MDVLIVDDSPKTRQMVRVLLESDPAFRVCGEAENGVEALEKAVKLRPGLIVMDMSMPMMNGLDAARWINKALPTISIILFTAYGNLDKLELFLSAGIFALVDKAEPSSLMEAAQQVLRLNAA